MTDQSSTEEFEPAGFLVVKIDEKSGVACIEWSFTDATAKAMGWKCEPIYRKSTLSRQITEDK